jgi:hypothetical protein
VELVVTKVEGGVDGLEGLEIDVNLALLSLGGDNFTTVHDQSIGGNLVVQLETLLGGGNGRQNGKTVDTRLDVGSSTLWCHIYILALRLLAGEERGEEEMKGKTEWRGNIHILQPTFVPLERPETWGLYLS